MLAIIVRTGDASPGNVFYRPASQSVTWIDWQLCCRGPPGFDLAQMMPLGLKIGLQPSDVTEATAMNERIVRAHWDAFVAASADPETAAALYTCEECWMDYRLGCILWAILYTCPVVMTLPLLIQQEDEEGMAAWRTVFSRMMQCWVALDIVPLAEELLQQVAQREAGAS